MVFKCHWLDPEPYKNLMVGANRLDNFALSLSRIHVLETREIPRTQRISAWPYASVRGGALFPNTCPWAVSSSLYSDPCRHLAAWVPDAEGYLPAKAAGCRRFLTNQVHVGNGEKTPQNPKQFVSRPPPCAESFMVGIEHFTYQSPRQSRVSCWIC